MKQFLLFLIFFFSYLTDVYFSLLSKTVNEDDQIIEDSRNIWISLVLKFVCILLLIYFMIYEIQSAKNHNDYFKEVWNYVDIFLISFYIPVAILDIMDIAYILTTIL